MRAAVQRVNNSGRGLFRPGCRICDRGETLLSRYDGNAREMQDV